MHFLGLGRQCTELLLPIGRLQLHHLGKVLCAGQALGEVEAGIYIPPGDVDDLAVERRGALACGVEGFLEGRDRSIERIG